jgi:hypothetical protein
MRYREESSWLTNAFTHRKIWPDDILWVHHEDVTNIKMVGRDIDTVKFLLTSIALLHHNDGTKYSDRVKLYGNQKK